MPVEDAAPEPAKPGSNGLVASSLPIFSGGLYLPGRGMWQLNPSASVCFLLCVVLPHLCSPWHTPEHFMNGWLPHICTTCTLLSASSGVPSLHSYPVAVAGHLCRPAYLHFSQLSHCSSVGTACLICCSETNHFFAYSADDFLWFCPSLYHLWCLFFTTFQRLSCDAIFGFSLWAVVL